MRHQLKNPEHRFDAALVAVGSLAVAAQTLLAVGGGSLREQAPPEQPQPVAVGW